MFAMAAIRLSYGERANKPFAPLAPLAGNDKSNYISASDEFDYDEH